MFFLYHCKFTHFLFDIATIIMIQRPSCTLKVVIEIWRIVSLEINLNHVTM